jgi:formamidopyrimidine-DNA glycosylase
MPELPEVETCRRTLLRWTEGRRIAAIDVLDPAAIRTKLSTLPSDAHPAGAAAVQDAVGAPIAGIDRWGKRLGVRFEGRDLGWLVHLGMTGQWVAGDGDRARVIVRLSDGGSVAFEDGRRFGCIAPVAVDAIDAALRDGMGPDALLAPLDGAGLQAALKGKRPIKVALLDQAKLAGLGNIHAAEALWRAGIHPSTACQDLTAAQFAALAAAIPAQLVPFVADDASTYVNAGGENPFVLYDREGEACPRCATAIERQVDAGRSTYFCPNCQKS